MRADMGGWFMYHYCFRARFRFAWLIATMSEPRGHCCRSRSPRLPIFLVNDHKTYHQQTTHLRSGRKSEICLRKFGTPAKNIGMSADTVDEMLSVSRMWRDCHCFQCAPVRHGDPKWSVLFQSPMLNATTRIAWFLPQRLRNFFIITGKGAFTSYRMSLPQLIRICTMITTDGLCFQHMYRAAWVMRLYNHHFDINDGALFPRTMFGGIAQFLDFDEINTVSITHTFMRCYIKSEMNQLRCLKVRDFSDMSYMFWMMKKAITNYGRSYLPVVAGNGINKPGQCKYSDKILTLLAGMDRLYKLDIESKSDTFRQSHEGRYRVILQKLFTRYVDQISLFEVDLVDARLHQRSIRVWR